MNKKVHVCTVILFFMVLLFFTDCMGPVGVVVPTTESVSPFIPLKIKMIDIPVASEGATFPTGTGDSGTAMISAGFSMGETEVTNYQFIEVYQWALDNGKFDMTDNTAPNYLSSDTAKHGGQELVDLSNSAAWPGCQINFDTTDKKFTVDKGYEDYPIVSVSWYGAIMFCNWLTEMEKGQ